VSFALGPYLQLLVATPWFAKDQLRSSVWFVCPLGPISLPAPHKGQSQSKENPRAQQGHRAFRRRRSSISAQCFTSWQYLLGQWASTQHTYSRTRSGLPKMLVLEGSNCSSLLFAPSAGNMRFFGFLLPEDSRTLCPSRLVVSCLCSFDDFEGEPTPSKGRLTAASEWLDLSTTLHYSCADIIQIPSNDSKGAIADVRLVVSESPAR
jgi:hypothetical protein